MREVREIGLVKYFTHWTHYALGKRIFKVQFLTRAVFCCSFL